jgi:predicted secreted protein
MLVSLIRLCADDGGTTTSAVVGDVVSVGLAEMATSGFRWQVDHIDSHVLRPAGDSLVDGDVDGQGAPGKRTFDFDVIGPGLADLRLKRWRDWEGDVSVVERFAVTIDARIAGGA